MLNEVKHLDETALRCFALLNMTEMIIVEYHASYNVMVIVAEQETPS